MRKKALGKGLSALIPQGENITKLKLDEIIPNPYEIRKDPGNISELAQSIKEQGIIEPLVVRHTSRGYELVCGGRRLAACKKVGLREVPVVVKEATDRDMLEMALVENVQRKDLNAIEEAVAYGALWQEFGLSHEEIAQRVGKDRATVTNAIRLLNLPTEIKLWLKEGKLTAGHARALLQLKSKQEIVKLANKILKQKISVRATERRVTKPKDSLVFHLEEELSKIFETKVTITKGKKKGKIEIEFYSDDDLSKLIKAFGITL